MKTNKGCKSSDSQQKQQTSKHMYLDSLFDAAHVDALNFCGLLVVTMPWKSFYQGCLFCGPSSATEIPIFKRFKAVWKGIAHENFRSLDLKEGCETFKEATTKFTREVIGADRQVRDDYQELIKLMLISLGSSLPAIHWRAPGPVHNSRWMAKLLYSMKIVLFREQGHVFNLTKAEESRLHRFFAFLALLYAKAWAEAPFVAEAPRTDLQFWNDIGKFEKMIQ